MAGGFAHDGSIGYDHRGFVAIMMLPLVLLLLQAATAPMDVPTPNDPKARMQLAEKGNGLHGVNTPWHLKASYELFAADGKSSDKGTYEEWRVSEKQYRIAFHGPSISVEEFGTDHGVFRTGKDEWPRHPLSSIPGLVSRPVSQPQSSERTVLENFQQSSGEEKVPCTALRKPGFQQTPKNSRWFCFAAGDAVLLSSSAPSEGFQTIFEHSKLVHGRHIAYDMQQFLAGGPSMKVHIELLEDLDRAGLTALWLPVDASPVTVRLDSPGEVEAGHLIKKAAPVYPLLVKHRGIEGTVFVNGIIATDGHVTGLRVLAGPPLLRQAAIDAVRQWVYTPSSRDGKPVEVENDISVVFAVIR